MGNILGFYRDNGKENGNYYNRSFRKQDALFSCVYTQSFFSFLNRASDECV